MTKKTSKNTPTVKAKTIPHTAPPQTAAAPLSALVDSYAAAAQSKAMKGSHREDVVARIAYTQTL